MHCYVTVIIIRLQKGQIFQFGASSNYVTYFQRNLPKPDSDIYEKNTPQ